MITTDRIHPIPRFEANVMGIPGTVLLIAILFVLATYAMFRIDLGISFSIAFIGVIAATKLFYRTARTVPYRGQPGRGITSRNVPEGLINEIRAIVERNRTVVVTVPRGISSRFAAEWFTSFVENQLDGDIEVNFGEALEIGQAPLTRTIRYCRSSSRERLEYDVNRLRGRGWSCDGDLQITKGVLYTDFCQRMTFTP